MFLAIQRAKPPAVGGWDIPGGFCDGTHPADTAKREVWEETGLKVTIDALIGIYTDCYSYQDETVPTLNIYYVASLTRVYAPGLASGEATVVAWLPLSTPPSLAFNHQRDVIRDVANRVGGS